MSNQSKLEYIFLQEAYMVPCDRGAARAGADALLSRAIFHDGRLVRRPDPAQALFALAYLPVGFAVALFRVFFNLLIPVRFVRHTYRLTGIQLSVEGAPPPAPRPGARGSLLVCNHRTALDPIIVSIALGRPVTCVTYSVSRLSTAVSPIRAVALARDRKADAARVAALLEEGDDVVVCPEGTTCREPFLLRFSAMFAELTDRVVPVAVDARQGTYYGNTARGCKWLDPYFFYMNPRPGYRVTFLPPLQLQSTGRSAVDVANHVQSVIAKELGFKCTALTRKDKYMKLAGNDGTVKPRPSSNKSL
jgi:glycerol-3-phosphate acyltransferase